MPDKKPKKFVNLHYPGMKVDPNENLDTNLNPYLMWRFKAQIDNLGIEFQDFLNKSSVIFTSLNPLTIHILKSLALFGIGRFAIVGQSDYFSEINAPDPEQILSNPDITKPNANEALSSWISNTTPWAKLENFRELNVERQLEDIIKGFTIIIETESANSNILNLAYEYADSYFYIGCSSPLSWALHLDATETPQGSFALALNQGIAQIQETLNQQKKQAAISHTEILCGALRNLIFQNYNKKQSGLLTITNDQGTPQVNFKSLL